MNHAQEKAAKACKSAFRKAMAADLAVYLFDGAVYVVPTDIVPGEHDYAIEACELFGEEVTPIGMVADGGAGV